MKKFLFLMLFACLGLVMQAQGLNAKYVQMKKVYNFQEEFNEYRVNSFLKHKLEEAGYTVFYEDQELPQEAKADPCKVLKCNVERGKSMTATKLTVSLINCKNEQIFTANGESRVKLRSKSHVDALKNALEYSALNKK